MENILIFYPDRLDSEQTVCCRLSNRFCSARPKVGHQKNSTCVDHLKFHRPIIMYHTHTPKCGQFIILLVVRVLHTAPLEEVSDMQTSLQVRQIQVEYEYHALIASLIAGPWQFVSSFTPSISGAQLPRPSTRS
jgi:hypothetical protein